MTWLLALAIAFAPPARAAGVAFGSAAYPVTGIASFYAAPTGTAAAGPKLRRALGPHWRGAVIRVCVNGHCTRVRLTGWCQCYAGTRRERLVDISRGSFARLAPPSRGLVVVRVTW